VWQGLGEAFGGVGDQCHAANAAPLDGLSRELASEAPAAALRRHKESSEMARYTVTPFGERVGEADDGVVLRSATTVAAPGVSNARIARCGSLGDVG
jgi:hypothetical protein